MCNTTVRHYLFRGFGGCSDTNCIIRKADGVYTNGGCKCLINLTRAQLCVLSSRISAIADRKILSNKEY